jgi:hypothetical protein
MKIFDPDTNTMTPKAQTRFGVVMALFSLRSPMDPLGRILGYSWFGNVLSMSWMAWRGYQRRATGSAK